MSAPPSPRSPSPLDVPVDPDGQEEAAEHAPPAKSHDTSATWKKHKKVSWVDYLRDRTEMEADEKGRLKAKPEMHPALTAEMWSIPLSVYIKMPNDAKSGYYWDDETAMWVEVSLRG